MTLETAAVTSSTIVMNLVTEKGIWSRLFFSFLANFLKYIDDFSAWKRRCETCQIFGENEENPPVNFDFGHPFRH